MSERVSASVRDPVELADGDHQDGVRRTHDGNAAEAEESLGKVTDLRQCTGQRDGNRPGRPPGQQLAGPETGVCIGGSHRVRSDATGRQVGEQVGAVDDEPPSEKVGGQARDGGRELGSGRR